MNAYADQALAYAHFLRDSAATLSFNDFYLALNRAVGCDKVYAGGVFKHFQDNPAAFLASRNPQSQSKELIAAMADALTDHELRITKQNLSSQ